MPEGEKLAQLRLAAERAILGMIWLHGPVLAVTGWLTGAYLILGLGLWLAMSLVATAAHRCDPGSARTRATLAAGLCLMPVLMVLEFSGQPWQADAHMLFFAELAVTTALLDGAAIIGAAVVVACHHLSLNFILPEVVFPGGADFYRVLFHAVILVVETGVLVWLAGATRIALGKAEAASVEIRAMAEQREIDTKRLNEAAETARKEALVATADAFEARIGHLVDRVSDAARGLQATSSGMSATAEQTNALARSVSDSAKEASGGVQMAATAAEELSAAIAEITQQVANAARVTQTAVEDTSRTDGIVQALADGAQRIGQVVELIRSIAGQTNLLALNATIEAARAGEAGRGFAVVAGEVKSLAVETTRATAEIGAQIGRIQASTEEAVQAIRQVGARIKDVDAIASAIAAAVEEQGAATAEIARNVAQTAASTQDVTDSIGGVSHAAQETGNAARQVLESAAGLSGQAAELVAEVGRFVGGIRAA